MRAVGRTDPNTRRELRTAASCTLSAPAVVPPHKPIIDHTSPTRPRGPRVQKTTAVGRSAERAHAHHVTAALPLALDSHRAGLQALESSAIQIISNVHLHVRARPATLDGLWRRRCWWWRRGGLWRPSGASAADPQGAPLGGVDASSQLGQRNTAVAHLRRAGARCALRLNVAVQAVRHPHNPGGSSSTA